MLISPWPDQEGNKLQRQKILSFVYTIYNHNWRNISTIYIYNKTSIKLNILTIKQNTSGSRSGQGLISTPVLDLQEHNSSSCWSHTGMRHLPDLMLSGTIGFSNITAWNGGLLTNKQTKCDISPFWRSKWKRQGIYVQRDTEPRSDSLIIRHLCCIILFRSSNLSLCRSQWPRGLRRESAASRLLGMWVRIPLGGMDVCYEYCVLSGRGLCDDMITRPEESYRL